MKTIKDYTKKEFQELPLRQWNDDIGEFRSLVILPTRRKHDSGYRMMDFVAVDKNEVPKCRLSGCSDIIHIDGIGGYGKWKGNVPLSIIPKGWSIDCLHKSGLLRIFANGNLTCGAALSSFELYSNKIDEK